MHQLDLPGIRCGNKETTWRCIGFIYLVTKKITVDNAVEGHGKRQAEAVGIIVVCLTGLGNSWS